MVFASQELWPMKSLVIAVRPDSYRPKPVSHHISGHHIQARQARGAAPSQRCEILPRRDRTLFAGARRLGSWARLARFCGSS